MDKKFIYGIATVKFGNTTIGYIEKGSWDWGGTKPETTEVFAEQVPDAPVLTLVQSLPTIKPKFNLIQLDYENLHKILGGTLVTTGEGANATVTGWKAPTSLIAQRGSWTVDFVSGQTISIPNGTILANLGGKLTLSEVSKLECELSVTKPSDGSASYEIYDTPVEG